MSRYWALLFPLWIAAGCSGDTSQQNIVLLEFGQLLQSDGSITHASVGTTTSSQDLIDNPPARVVEDRAAYARLLEQNSPPAEAVPGGCEFSVFTDDGGYDVDVLDLEASCESIYTRGDNRIILSSQRGVPGDGRASVAPAFVRLIGKEPVDASGEGRWRRPRPATTLVPRWYWSTHPNPSCSSWLRSRTHPDSSLSPGFPARSIRVRSRHRRLAIRPAGHPGG